MKPKLLRQGFLLIACFLWASLYGCTCSINIVSNPSFPQPSPPDAGPSQQLIPSGTAPLQVKIRGLALLSFYPNLPSVDEGTLGGYVLIYSKVQTTTIPFSGMRDNSCEFNSWNPQDTREVPDYHGLDLGTLVNLQFLTHQWTLPQNPLRENEPKSGAYYALPTVQSLQFAYGKTFSFRASGGKDVNALRIDAAAPSRLEILQPKLLDTPTTIPQQQPLPLRWTFPSAPYFSVRINQRNEDNTERRSLTCRFANKGSGSIPAEQLKKFSHDDKGTRTQIFFFAGSYTLTQIPGLEEPVITVVEAISTTPVIFPQTTEPSP